MKRIALAGMCAFASLALGSTAQAQNWTGAYVGGSVGPGFQPKDGSETVRFDTNLDRTFTDTVRTAAGANAFSPGFCGGLAVNAIAANGCTSDEDGIDFGGRAGYDWQIGRLAFGGVVDVSRADLIDSVTAFSTTPAFYAFTRELNAVVGFRGRAGVGNNRLLVYGTAGSAWGNVKHVFTTSNRVNTFVPTERDRVMVDGSNDRAWGYQAGGGVELRLGRRLSLVSEYLFTSLDDREQSGIRSQGPAPATNPFILVNSSGTDFQRAEKFELQSARVGLSYRF